MPILASSDLWPNAGADTIARHVTGRRLRVASRRGSAAATKTPRPHRHENGAH